MLKNFFKMTGRQWRSSPSYSLINLGGLTAGLAITLLIGLWINDELSFDHNFTNHSRLARLMDTQPSGAGVSTGELLPPPLAAELRARDGRFFKHLALVFPNFPHVLATGEKKITASGEWAQPDWPEMLSLKMISGTRDALKDPSSALIDQSTAITLFGSPAASTRPYADLVTEVRLVDGRFMASEPHHLDQGPEPPDRYDVDLTPWLDAPTAHELVGYIREVREGEVRDEAAGS